MRDRIRAREILEIPHTAVWGSFKSILHGGAPGFPFFLYFPPLAALGEGEITKTKGAGGSLCRLDSNDPHTAVWGIPDEQAAIMLREVLGFSNQEAATMLEISEPVFRHRLSAARSKMTSSYEGLCQLINKTGVCWQCKGLHELAGPGHNGGELVHIEVAPGVDVSAKSLFDARLKIVHEAGFPESKTRRMHDVFFDGLTRREELENR